MIGHFVEVMARAVLGAVGVKVGPKLLGRCSECTCRVWDDEKRVQLHGAWFHADCAVYVRRRDRG